VTTEAASRTPAGEAGFRLLAEHLPNLILLAFDAELLIWAATGAALRGECRRLDTSGKTDPSRLWSHTFVPLPDEGGVVIGGMVIARDVTDERRAERQLVASRRQLAEAQRIAQVGSWEWDLASDELTISDEMGRIIGLPPGSRLQMRPGVVQFVHPADVPTRPAPWSRSSAPATAWSCGSATTAAASTPTTCRCSPTPPTSA
jgi:PAS domain-containing protein